MPVAASGEMTRSDAVSRPAPGAARSGPGRRCGHQGQATARSVRRRSKTSTFGKRTGHLRQGGGSAPSPTRSRSPRPAPCGHLSARRPTRGRRGAGGTGPGGPAARPSNWAGRRWAGRTGRRHERHPFTQQPARGHHLHLGGGGQGDAARSPALGLAHIAGARGPTGRWRRTSPAGGSGRAEELAHQGHEQRYGDLNVSGNAGTTVKAPVPERPGHKTPPRHQCQQCRVPAP